MGSNDLKPLSNPIEVKPFVPNLRMHNLELDLMQENANTTVLEDLRCHLDNSPIQTYYVEKVDGAYFIARKPSLRGLQYIKVLSLESTRAKAFMQGYELSPHLEVNPLFKSMQGATTVSMSQWRQKPFINNTNREVDTSSLFGNERYASLFSEKLNLGIPADLTQSMVFNQHQEPIYYNNEDLSQSTLSSDPLSDNMSNSQLTSSINSLEYSKILTKEELAEFGKQFLSNILKGNPPNPSNYVWMCIDLWLNKLALQKKQHVLQRMGMSKIRNIAMTFEDENGYLNAFINKLPDVYPRNISWDKTGFSGLDSSHLRPLSLDFHRGKDLERGTLSDNTKETVLFFQYDVYKVINQTGQP